MKTLKLKIIKKYLKPYKKEFLYGAIALLLVNILSVLIPLEVKNIIDQLKDGFSSSRLSELIFFCNSSIFSSDSMTSDF